MSDNFIRLDSQVKFMVPHIGGDLNDNKTDFINQKNIIQNEDNLYTDILDENRNSLRNKDTDKTYIQEKKNEFYTTDSRINNFPTTLNYGDVNISNPIIYPKEYDAYFEYLFKKNLFSINTQVKQNKLYINVDSSKRNIHPTMNVLSYINLVSNPLVFTNNTDILQIKLLNANKQFNIGDKITLQGFNFYTINYKNINLYFENKSNKVILDLTPNFSYQIPYYNVMIEISGIVNGNLNYFKNIPLNVLNDIHMVSLYTTLSNELKFMFSIPMNFFSDNVNSNVLTCNCSIKYYFLGNYPINYINSGIPTSFYNLNTYFIIHSVDASNIYIKLTNPISLTNTLQISGNWINNSIFETGGDTIQIGLITKIIPSNPKPSHYRINFEKRIDNIVCIQMKSSEIPNTSKLIYDIPLTNTVFTSNNMFYWENVNENIIYNIKIPSGNYTFNELSCVMEKLIEEVPKITEIPNIIPFNKMKININQSNNITSITSFNMYSLPNCITNLNIVNSLTWILTINHPSHNQSIGNFITIENSTNYKNIDALYINKQHIITEVLNNNSYNITIKNINPLIVSTDGNGGNQIIIHTMNSFKLYFDKTDTIGNILGFKNVGEIGSITPFCNKDTNYTIDNTQSYIFGMENIQTVNNNQPVINSSNNFNFDRERYILLKSNDEQLNKCKTLNGISYFYKILLKGKPNKIMFNTFVDNPIYFNPALTYLEYLDFIFLTDNGEEFEFYSINNSMTFEITTITNCPENTNISTNIARQ
jgi:hypothetical protein